MSGRFAAGASSNVPSKKSKKYGGLQQVILPGRWNVPSSKEELGIFKNLSKKRKNKFEYYTPGRKLTNEEVYAQPHKEGQIFLNGQWLDEAQVIDWMKDYKGGITKRWTPEKIRQLQIEMGMPEKKQTGIYGSETRKKHLEFLKSRTKLGGVDEQLAVNASLAGGGGERDETWAEKTLQEKTQIKESMANYYSQIFGQDPSEAIMTWMAKNNTDNGWGFTKFKQHFRSTPQFQKLFPGITDKMEIEEYNQHAADINAQMLQYYGRPAKEEDYAKWLRGKMEPPKWTIGSTPSLEGLNPTLGGR